MDKLSEYILAFDQTKNNSLKNLIKMIYKCIGDENNKIQKKDENAENKEENPEEINLKKIMI